MFVHDTTTFIVDDEPALVEASVEALELVGMPARGFARPEDLLAALTPDFGGAVVTDVRMPGVDGMEVLRRVHTVDPQVPVILVTGHGDMALAIEALRAGAVDFLPKPFAADHLTGAVGKAIAMRRYVLDQRALNLAKAQAETEESPLIGQHPAMIALRRTIDRIAPTETDVLIEGETGTGKELVALLLHRRSRRKGKPFVAVNCGGLAEATFEAEMFGVGEGTRSGVARSAGRIEAANGGTLFLDEIDSLPPALQIRLLRVIEEREVHPAGAGLPRPVDIRVIAAAKPDLREAIAAGRFRADLYHRLAMIVLALPPLRDRRSDVPLLFASCVEAAQARLAAPAFELTDDIRRRLIDHDWPGNVRELRNFAIQAIAGLTATPAADPPATLADRVDRFEEQIIRDALAASHGSIRDAVELLQVPRKTLYDKLARYRIDASLYRGDG